MSLAALSWAVRLTATEDVTDAALRTLSVLADYANAQGVCWPSVGRLMNDRALSRSTIFAHIRQLENDGLMERAADHELEHLPANRRPTVWRLKCPALGSSLPDPTSLGGPDHRTLGVQPGRTHREEPPDESRRAAMPSEAWADIGGVTTPPLAKRFPDQCERHQAIKSIDPCLGCKAARQARERAASAATAAARRDRGEAAARQRRQAAEAILRCDMCDASGRMPGGRVCPHEESVPMPEELRELIRNGGRSR